MRQWWLMLLLCLTLPAAAAQKVDMEAAANLRSVWFGADQLPTSLAGLPLASLSLARWQDGRFEPIPFQFDELNQLGLVYFDGQLAERDGKADIFDGHDQLGFMWQDAGAEAPATAQPDVGKRLADISVSLPGVDLRHVYLLQGDAARSSRSYVDQHLDTGVTQTPYYTLDVDPDNEIDWRSFRYQGYTGAGSIVDNLRMRMSGRMLTKVSPRITLDNDNLKPRLLAVHTGPIRTVMLLKIHVVLLGIPVMTIYEQVSRYASRYQAVTYTRIPSMYRASLKEPRVAVSIVGNALLGAEVTTALSNGHSVKVDGRMSAAETQLVKNGIDMQHNWISFDSQRNFAMVTHLDVPDSLSEVPVSLVYEDVKADRHNVALLPNLGYAINAWPKEQELQFSLDLLFDNGLHGASVEQYLALRLGAAAVLVKAAAAH